MVRVAGASTLMVEATMCTVPAPAQVSSATTLLACCTTVPLGVPQAVTGGAQVTATVVTAPFVTLPLALPTVQACVGPPGCVRTVTLYVEPLAMAVAKVKLPLPEMV